MTAVNRATRRINCIAWAVTHPLYLGRQCMYALRYTRREAVKHAADAHGRPWTELRAVGWRVVKVRVTEC